MQIPEEIGITGGFLFQMGLVCFRLKGKNELNQKLLSNINASGKLHMVPASVHGRFVIRFCVCAPDAKDSDIDYAWDVINDFATELEAAEIIKDKRRSSGVPLTALEIIEEEVSQLNIYDIVLLNNFFQYRKPNRTSVRSSFARLAIPKSTIRKSWQNRRVSEFPCPRSTKLLNRLQHPMKIKMINQGTFLNGIFKLKW